jgi:hypothetical protein
MCQLSADAPFHPRLHGRDDIHRSDEIHHQAITSDFSELVFPCQRLVVLVQYCQDDIGCAQVDRYM